MQIPHHRFKSFNLILCCSYKYSDTKKQVFMQTPKYLLLSISMTLCVNLSFSQTKAALTFHEQSCVKLFTEFFQHVKLRLHDPASHITITDSSGQSEENGKLNDSLRRLQRIEDTADMKYILANYIFAIDIKNDLTEAEQFKTASGEIQEFYDFCDGNNIDQVNIKPLHLCSDTYNRYIYSHCNDFQKANAFIFFNKNSPEKVLGYVLFAPAEAINFSTPKILSWKLTFSYGKYYFADIYGRLGLEDLFQGVKRPDRPVDVKKELGVYQRSQTQ